MCLRTPNISGKDEMGNSSTCYIIKNFQPIGFGINTMLFRKLFLEVYVCYMGKFMHLWHFGW